MYAKILIDNVSENDLLSEWGLAVYIEHEGRCLLLDTGAGENFAANAAAMGVRLEDVEAGVLSHAHFDHADGLAAFFKVNQKAFFYLRKDAAENCYSVHGEKCEYIGIHKGYLQTYADRIRYVDGDYEVLPGIWLIPHKTEGLDRQGIKANMYRKTETGWQPDAFEHEQSLVLDTDRGLVIFNSCSHGGADNIIREITATFPGKQIYALIGGLHLFESTEEEVYALADRIRATGIRKIITGHCTGDRAMAILREELGDIVESFCTGKEIRI